jgi:lipopolysaccharide transport system ATP-binding protein
MTDPQLAVKVADVSKRYRIGKKAGSGSLYDRIGSSFSRGDKNGTQPVVWALRNVSLEVPKGHVIAFIGRNGSGKTTLMKILARVTHPTEGYAEVRGRVGAMLQAGAGFHMELSGRDNIALSGSILGMSKREIMSLQQSIIDFAAIGDFLDTPVKFYSSGMHMRLAFSVSAHLPCEVMIIDEALSVGDLTFQVKCQERIKQVVNEGRTVLFVSHAMPAVRSLCDQTVVLDKGNMKFVGDTEEAIRYYTEEVLHVSMDTIEKTL